MIATVTDVPTQTSYPQNVINGNDTETIIYNTTTTIITIKNGIKKHSIINATYTYWRITK